MSSQLEDADNGLPRYYGMLLGFVSDIEDPLGLHRAKVQIPGISEPSTDWLYPATMGGGSAERGGHVMPDVGATTAVWFHMGDPQGQGIYLPCAWSAPEDKPIETPYEAKQAGTDAHLVQTMRIGRIVIAVDERPDKESLRIYDAKGGFDFVVDLVKKQVRLLGLVGLRLESKGRIQILGTEITVNDRRVNPTSSPI